MNYFHTRKLSGTRNDQWGNYCDVSDINCMENCHSPVYNSGIPSKICNKAGKVFCIKWGNNCTSIIASCRASLLSMSAVFPPLAVLGFKEFCIYVQKISLKSLWLTTGFFLKDLWILMWTKQLLGCTWLGWRAYHGHHWHLSALPIHSYSGSWTLASTVAHHYWHHH